MDILDIKYFAPSSIGYTPRMGPYENSDPNLMLKSLLTKKLKTKISKDDIRLRSKLTTNKTILFTVKSFFCTIKGSTQSR